MRLTDADELRKVMYHEAFETDSDMQKWDGGCWIRYKMFEKAIDSIPTIDAVPVIRCKECVHYKGRWYCDAWNNSPGFPAVTEDGFCNMAERRTDATD